MKDSELSERLAKKFFNILLVACTVTSALTSLVIYLCARWGFK